MDQGFIDLRRFKVELLQFLGERQLGDGHLVFDRPGLLFSEFGGQQIPDDLLRFVLAFDGGGQHLFALLQCDAGCLHSVVRVSPRRQRPPCDQAYCMF